jgi:hypothetical protein
MKIEHLDNVVKLRDKREALWKEIGALDKGLPRITLSLFNNADAALPVNFAFTNMSPDRGRYLIDKIRTLWLEQLRGQLHDVEGALRALGVSV